MNEIIKKSEKQLADNIYKNILNYLNKKNMSARELSIRIGVPYTTFMSWLEILREGRCILIKNILAIENATGESMIDYF